MKYLHYKMHHDAETDDNQESAAHVDCRLSGFIFNSEMSSKCPGAQ